jgi:oligopeptide/dipeptide ABC transporter ATP-binding protein
VIIFDEAVSSLDTLIQAQVLDLLQKLRAKLELSYVFITHDLAVVETVADRVAVLHRGQLCEVGSTATVFGRALHPYTQVLISSALEWSAPVGPEARPTTLASPSRAVDRTLPACRYYARCVRANELCATVVPKLRVAGPEDHMVACHFPLFGAEPDRGLPRLPEEASAPHGSIRQ